MLVKPDGSEYFLLENQQKKGYNERATPTGQRLAVLSHKHPPTAGRQD